jgi:hypothetical protein
MWQIKTDSKGYGYFDIYVYPDGYQNNKDAGIFLGSYQRAGSFQVFWSTSTEKRYHSGECSYEEDAIKEICTINGYWPVQKV